jgi:hypothetical protein
MFSPPLQFFNVGVIRAATARLSCVFLCAALASVPRMNHPSLRASFARQSVLPLSTSDCFVAGTSRNDRSQLFSFRASFAPACVHALRSSVGLAHPFLPGRASGCSGGSNGSSLRAKRGNLVFVRIFVLLCHPEVIPKDLLVEDCQAKILRCAQNDTSLFRHCERSVAIWCSSLFFSPFVILRLYRRIF